MSTWSRSRSERCVKAENADRRSRLSPKNSALTGSRPVDGKMSTRPPRTENWPRSSTVSARSYPAPASSRVSSSKGRSSPRRSSTGRGRTAGGGRRSTRASAETATRPPAASVWSARDRSPARCGGGSRPAPWAAPRDGMKATASPGQECGRRLGQRPGGVVVADEHGQAARLGLCARRPEGGDERAEQRLGDARPRRARHGPPREGREVGVVQEIRQGELRPSEGRVGPLPDPFRHRRLEW